MIEGPLHFVLLVFTAVAGAALCWPLIPPVRTRRRRRLAIALHRQNWTHGQIAQALGEDPRTVAAWLADADRAGG